MGEIHARELEGDRVMLTSVVGSAWQWKKGERGSGGLEAGFWWATLRTSGKREEVGWPNWWGWFGSSPFFLTTTFSFFSKQQTTITFKLELQKTSNKFLKFCTNKHTQLGTMH